MTTAFLTTEVMIQESNKIAMALPRDNVSLCSPLPDPPSQTQMPKSQIGIAAISNRSDLKSQTSKSVERRVEITNDIAMIRIAAVSNG